jgi:mobilization protein
MIAKILKHSKSFAGLEYNRLKTENGKAEMLEAKNFELDAMAGLTGRPNVSTYLDFLNYVADRRPDIGYRQFHAVISCSGREMSKEQLLDAARTYLDKMGYADQPYLVFFHKDTDNNHVHIVTTRVRYDGTLVPDNKERFRSLAAIREINRQFGISEEPDLRTRAQNDIRTALSWSFAYDSNLVSVFAGMGYKLEKSATDPDMWVLSSDGERCGTIGQGDIDACKKRYRDGISVRINGKLPADRQPDIYKRKQLLYAKFTGYAAKGYSLEEVMSLHELREQLGFHIESTVRKDKDGNERIHWTITDYPGKTIFRGSDVFPVETLVRSEEFRAGADHFYDLVNQVLAEEGPKCGWRTFEKRMKELGYTLHTGKGHVAYATVPGGKGQFHLPKDAVMSLHYNQRVINVSAMDIHSEEELQCLSAIHRVKVQDIRPPFFELEDKPARRKALQTVRSLTNNLSGNDLSVALKNEGVSAVLMGNRLFLYHPHGGLFTPEQTGLDWMAEDCRKLGMEPLDVQRMSRYYDHWTDYLNEHTVTYPEREEKPASGRAAGNDEGKSSGGQEGGSSKRKRAEDYGRGVEHTVSPAMDAVLRPISLAGFLEQMARIAYSMKAGGGGGGRSRRRKRKDDDDDD